MLEFGVDEITLVLQLPKIEKLTLQMNEWHDAAERLIGVFEFRADLVRLLGERHLLHSKLPAGYTTAYAYGEHSFYLSVAYNGQSVNRGVAVRFSAQALAYYLQESGLQLYGFLQQVKTDAYVIGLSRIDLTVDFFDEQIDTTKIYNEIIGGRLAVFRECESKRTGKTQYLKVNLSVKGFAVGEEVPTVYLGSPRSNSQLRIYDKRLEQIQRRGTHYDKALACKSWVRFEAVYRNEYSHQLTEMLLNVTSDGEMKRLIAATFGQKYRFMNVIDGVIDDDAEYTKMILRAARGYGAVLQAPESRTFDIVSNLRHLFFKSGTFPTLYKVKDIWGDDALNALLDYIVAAVREWVPNSDCRNWLRRNKNDTIRSHPDFDALLTDYIKTAL